MRTLAMTILMGLGIALNSSAGEAPGWLKKEIRKSVSYPEFAMNEKLQGMVMVKYEVTDDGTITVMEMNASHAELAEYVREQMEKIVLTDTSATGIHYAKFNFRFQMI